MSTWSGEEEESLAWERLIAARKLVKEVEKDDPGNPGLKDAWKSVYAAEGSDWFWWYGLDQDSGYDELWDELFKTHLMNIYTSLDAELPPYLKNLWLPPEVPVEKAYDVIDPGVDGYAIPGEWDGAYHFSDGDAAEVEEGWNISSVRVGYSSRDLFVRVDMAGDTVRRMRNDGAVDLALYVGAPNARDMNVYSTNYLTKYGGQPLNHPGQWRVKIITEEVLFILFQRYLISGMTKGAVKG